MSDNKFPYVRAAFINAIREEGTKAEACDYLQEQWNETCALRAEITRLRAQVEGLTEDVNGWIDTAYAARDREEAAQMDVTRLAAALKEIDARGPDGAEMYAIAFELASIARTALATYQQAKEGGE